MLIRNNIQFYLLPSSSSSFFLKKILSYLLYFMYFLFIEILSFFQVILCYSFQALLIIFQIDQSTKFNLFLKFQKILIVVARFVKTLIRVYILIVILSKEINKKYIVKNKDQMDQMKNLDCNQIKIFINLEIIREEKLYIFFLNTII